MARIAKTVVTNGKRVPVLTKGMSGKAVTAAFAKADKPARKAKAAPVANPDEITVLVSTKGSTHIYAGSRGEDSVTFPNAQDSKECRKVARKGGSLKALKAWLAANPVVKPVGKLARGLDTQSAPHCAKSVRDNRQAEASTDTRTIKVLDKKFSFGGDGTARRAAWDAVKSGITVPAYVAAGGKAKYLARWVSAKAISLSA